MRHRKLKSTLVLVALTVFVGISTRAQGADPDWKAVEQALGKPGQLQPGDVFRVGMPRTDLASLSKVFRSRPGSPLDPTRPQAGG